MSSPLRRCVQTAIAALRRIPTPEKQPVRFLLHPQLQEIYLGPADTGRTAAEISADFVSEASIRDEDVQSGRLSYPSWLDLDVSLLAEEWYRAKELLPKHSSLTTPDGRRLFARTQANAVLEFLHSQASWIEDQDHPMDRATESLWREQSVLIVGHAGALGALLPEIPGPERPGRKHKLRNGQVVKYLLEVSDRNCRFEPIAHFCDTLQRVLTPGKRRAQIQSLYDKNIFGTLLATPD